MKISNPYESNSMCVKIAIFLPSLRGGGAQRVAVQVGNALAENGIKVDLVVAKSGGKYQSEVSSKVRLLFMNCDRTVGSLMPLTNYLKNHDPTVLFCGQPHAGLVGWLAGIISRWEGRLVIRETNSISRPSGDKLGVKNWLVRRLVEYVYHQADLVIAPSSGVADEIGPKATVIYNPVDRVLISKQAEVKLPECLSDGIPFVLGVGRLCKQKRFDDLISAFALLRRDLEIRLILLGEGPDEKKLRAHANDLGVGERVFFMGFDNNPYRYMSRCAAFVLSSGWEGLPNVLLQAMACNAPIVATDCQHGPREILNSGEWGALIPVGDVFQLAEAIEKKIMGGRVEYPVDALKLFEPERVFHSYRSLLLALE